MPTARAQREAKNVKLRQFCSNGRVKNVEDNAVQSKPIRGLMTLQQQPMEPRDFGIGNPRYLACTPAS